MDLERISDSSKEYKPLLNAALIANLIMYKDCSSVKSPIKDSK
jgi:hypothetical protein